MIVFIGMGRGKNKSMYRDRKIYLQTVYANGVISYMTVISEKFFTDE